MASRDTQYSWRDLWRRAQHGWPAAFPLVQFPNAPLLFAFAGMLVATFTSGAAHDYARGGVYTGLAAWAWAEVAAGTNWFRRVLGAAMIVNVIVKLGETIGA